MTTGDKIKVTFILLTIPASFLVMPFETALIINLLMFGGVGLMLLIAWVGIRENDKIIKSMSKKELEHFGKLLKEKGPSAIGL